jgi:hypothetical protein
MAQRLTDEQWTEIQEQHKGVRLHRLPTAAGEFVIRAPTPQEESIFQGMLFADGPGKMHTGMAWRNLLSMLLVPTPIHPDRAAFKKALDDWPGIPLNSRVIRELKLIRGEADEEEGK